jgi:5-methylcytosine-specific restriction endonuclease McrA
MERDCKYCGKEFKGRLRSIFCSRKCSNKGREVSEKTRNKFSKFHSTRPRKRFTIDTKIKMSLAKTKEKEFTGFKSTDNHRIRNSIENSEWIIKVFTGDEFTCCLCNNVGGRLEAHHIKQFSKYPELRFDINNGITLCKECHKKIDKYRH